MSSKIEEKSTLAQNEQALLTVAKSLHIEHFTGGHVPDDEQLKAIQEILGRLRESWAWRAPADAALLAIDAHKANRSSSAAVTNMLVRLQAVLKKARDKKARDKKVSALRGGRFGRRRIQPSGPTILDTAFAVCQFDRTTRTSNNRSTLACAQTTHGRVDVQMRKPVSVDRLPKKKGMSRATYNHYV